MSKFLFIFVAVILCSGFAQAGSLGDLYDSGRDSSKKAPSLDASELDLWGQVRFQWGYLVSKATVDVLKHDVTCDGHVDYVVARLNHDNPDGPFFDILVVTRDGGELISEGVSLAFDGSQDGLCGLGGLDAQIGTEIEHWDDDQLDEAFGSEEDVCAEAIRVDDGMCDAMRYFWLTGDRDVDADAEGSRLMSFRR